VGGIVFYDFYLILSFLFDFGEIKLLEYSVDADGLGGVVWICTQLGGATNPTAGLGVARTECLLSVWIFPEEKKSRRLLFSSGYCSVWTK
jgi:hypothetical protein